MYKETKKAYDAENTIQVKLKLNMKTDADILKKLENVWNKQGYIKDLIRKDLASNGARIRYRLLKFDTEADERYLIDVQPGVSLEIGDDRGFDDPETLQIFMSKREAFGALADYQSDISRCGYKNAAGFEMWRFVEYAIEIYEVDENEEFEQGFDYEFADFKRIDGITPDIVKLEEYPTNFTIHVYRAGDPDEHVWKMFDIDGLEIDKDDCRDFAEADVEEFERTELFDREITPEQREDLLDSLETYYSWKTEG